MSSPTPTSTFPAYNCTSNANTDIDNILLDWYKDTNGDIKGLLPAISNSSSTYRDTNTNMLTESTLTTILNSDMVKNLIPDATTTNADTYHAKILTFLNNANKEFCYYYSRYSRALTLLLSEITKGYKDQTDITIKNEINTKLNTLRTLNTRLNDLTVIAHKVSQNLAAKSDTLQTEIDKFNTEMKDQRDKLTNQNKIITYGNADITIRKEMVKFTEEKARNSDNLLKLYSFLNVVVLGLLVYVYKAASD